MKLVSQFSESRLIYYEFSKPKSISKNDKRILKIKNTQLATCGSARAWALLMSVLTSRWSNGQTRVHGSEDPTGQPLPLADIWDARVRTAKGKEERKIARVTGLKVVGSA
jgi:hypothetical protein